MPSGITSIFNTLGIPNVTPAGESIYAGYARCVTGLKGVNLGGPTSWLGEGSFTRLLQSGASENTSVGYLAPPSLQLSVPGFWRFRWTVAAGTHTVSCYVMQTANLAPFPTMVVKSNSAIGVGSDVTVTSPGGTGWVLMGPATITPTSEGVVWVELHNNLNLSNVLWNPGATPGTPCQFGQITVT